MSNHARVSRRAFLSGVGVIGGGLVVSFACAPSRESAPPTAAARVSATEVTGAFNTPGAATPVATAAPAPQPTAAPAPAPQLDAWLRVGEDGQVTLYTGKVEFGQGIRTGFGQLVAEELDLRFDQVDVVMGATNAVPSDRGTFDSASTRNVGPIVRDAAAEMRRWLIELAAPKLGVQPDQLVMQDGVIHIQNQPDKNVTFGALAGGQTAQRPISGSAPRKDPSQYRAVGQPIPKVDIPQKVNGTYQYGYDTTLASAVYAKLVRPPTIGATLDSVDFSAAERMPGVVGSFHDGDFAGIAATSREQATAALSAVKATWKPGPVNDMTSENIHERLRQTADGGTPIKRTDGFAEGDPTEALAAAAKSVKVTVKAPFLAHAPIEPQAALAHVQADKVEIWVASQAPFGVRTAAANVLKRDPDTVVVYHAGEGGAFGGKITPTVAVEAARASAALGKPVRINWTREEEFQLDQFRPAMLIEVTTGLTASGDVAGWQYDLYHASRFPPGARQPQFTAAEQTADVTAMYPNLPNVRTMNYRADSPLPVFVWRANGRPVNALARESAIDQLAEQAGLDPIAFREKLLKDNPRMLAVMRAVVEKARQSGYTPRSQPAGNGTGYGFALDFGNETFVAQVARVDVDRTSGRVAVRHVDVAVDCGLVVNPLAVTTQVEGSVVQSTSAALKEELTFGGGRVTSTMFAQYPILSIAEAPSVDVVFVEDKTNPMTGIGEPAVGPVAAAISAAVYDAVGVRLLDLPFRAEKVIAALSGHQ